MTDREKLIKIKKLADKMYDAAFYLTTDASLLRKAMDEYHKFVIHECKEEPVSNDFEKALAEEWKGYTERGAATVDALEDNTQELTFAKGFYRGAKWQIAKLIKDATEVTVHIDAGNYPYIPQIELYDYDKDIPLAKEGDKYKVILIKE